MTISDTRGQSSLPQARLAIRGEAQGINADEGKPDSPHEFRKAHSGDGQAGGMASLSFLVFLGLSRSVVFAIWIH